MPVELEDSHAVDNVCGEASVLGSVFVRPYRCVLQGYPCDYCRWLHISLPAAERWHE